MVMSMHQHRQLAIWSTANNADCLTNLTTQNKSVFSLLLRLSTRHCSHVPLCTGACCWRSTGQMDARAPYYVGSVNKDGSRDMGCILISSPFNKYHFNVPLSLLLHFEPSIRMFPEKHAQSYSQSPTTSSCLFATLNQEKLSIPQSWIHLC